jgi:putative FmdB family regulatory protein
MITPLLRLLLGVATQESPFTGDRVEESSMPTYEYRCRECKKQFERVEALAEHGHGRPQCPQCKSRQVEQVFTAFFAKTARKA